MKLVVKKDAREIGILAAEKAAKILDRAVKDSGRARMLVSTGASQFEFFDALLKRDDIDWGKIEVFHLDEYLNLPKEHKASFRKYLDERFISLVKPKAFFEVSGEGDIEANIATLTEELLRVPVDLGVIGIGENGHIAFNDPPADFDSKDAYIVVDLDDACKLQQVNEGWFSDTNAVPAKAVTMSVHQIMQCKTILSFVPYEVKAKAVKNTLEAEVPLNTIPASILKTHGDWTLYLDHDSASLLDRTFVEKYKN